MRLLFRIRSLAALLFCCSSALVAQASHMLGGELTYEYAGTAANPNLYHVTARLFQDVTSVVTTTALMMTCGKNECGNTLPGSFTFVLMATGNVQKSIACASGPSLLYRVTTLEGSVELAPARWTLSIRGENRRSGIVNVVQSEQQNFYVAAELDNTAGVRSSSPRFTTAQLIQLSGTQAQQRHSLSAFDSDGDSLVYRLVSPQGVSLISNCSIGAIGTIAPHFQINAGTGELVTVATGLAQQGVYNISARVDEYRRLNGSWQQIGSVMRDMVYLVQAGTNALPAFTRVALAGNPTGQLLGQPILVNPGQTLTLTLTAADADPGQTLTLSSDVMAVVPGTSFQDLGNGQGRLTWQVPATLPLGRYPLAVSATDNACPISGVDVVTLPIQVTSLALATQHARQPLTLLPFPSPFQDEVRLQLAEPGRQVVLITNELGQVVAQLTTEPDGTLVWRPAANQAPGLYLARNLTGTQVARLAYAGQ